ncbi:MAG: RnfH family protein [Proteobacteria bacterium]|nr:RnfH family protein [Pseudomonadota bacterium]
MSAVKHITVVYAAPDRQVIWRLAAPAAATVAELLVLARRQSGCEDVPWESADVGIFGELCARDTVPRHGDRVELYRPLTVDPKESRRSRARRRGRGSG